MRIIKEYDERKNEILDAAEKLFIMKGYSKCTINDILKEVSIAKGTFYYYFKSKEEVMDAIVIRYTDLIKKRIEKVMDNKDSTPLEKLFNVFMAMKIDTQIDKSMLDEIHKAENALMHQKSLNTTIKIIVPFLVEIIEEGNKKKIWSCKYPSEYINIFLAAALTLMDDGIFALNNQDKGNIETALFSVLEMMLNMPEGSIQEFIIKHMEEK